MRRLLVLGTSILLCGCLQPNASAHRSVAVRIKQLQEGDVPARLAAAAALGAPDVHGPEVVPALIAALTDEDEDVARAAGRSLRAQGAAAEQALLETMTDKNASGVKRARAVEVLGAMAGSPKAEAAVLNALHDDDPFVRVTAAEIVDLSGPHSTAAVPALTAALKDDSKVVRLHAARALGKIGAAAQAALPALRTAAGDSDPGVRQAASEAVQALQ